jgi:hypothetical protein
MRTFLRLTLLLLALALIVPTTRAAEPTEPIPDAPARYAPGTPSMVTAMQIGAQRWGFMPCDGEIALSWREMPQGTNATSTWANPIAAYGRPEENSACQIAFSTAASFDWRKFCTVVVHELGHLAGMPHSERPDDIMAEYYDAADPTCARTPDPSGFVPEGSGASSVASVVKVVRNRNGKAKASVVRRGVSARRATRR